MIRATLEEIFGHYPEQKPPFQSGNEQFLPSQKAQKLSVVSLGATMKVIASMRIAQMDVNRRKDYQRAEWNSKNA